MSATSENGGGIVAGDRSSRCSGTTVHVWNTTISCYRGLPRCLDEIDHFFLFECAENAYSFVSKTPRNRKNLNAWVHFPQDGSNLWMPKALMVHFFSACAERMASMPGFAVFVERKVSSLLLKLVINLWYDVCMTPNQLLPPSSHEQGQNNEACRQAVISGMVPDSGHAKTVICSTVVLESAEDCEFGISQNADAILQESPARLSFPCTRIWLENSKFILCQLDGYDLTKIRLTNARSEMKREVNEEVLKIFARFIPQPTVQVQESQMTEQDDWRFHYSFCRLFTIWQFSDNAPLTRLRSRIIADSFLNILTGYFSRQRSLAISLVNVVLIEC